MVDPQRLQDAYKRLPHGPSLQVLAQILQVDSDEIVCAVATNSSNPLAEGGDLVASFTYVEYAAQAAAIHGILMGAHYDPMRPAYIGAVKDLQLHHSHYSTSAEIKISARQEFSQSDGAIYHFAGYADGLLQINGRLILKK